MRSVTEAQAEADEWRMDWTRAGPRGQDRIDEASIGGSESKSRKEVGLPFLLMGNGGTGNTPRHFAKYLVRTQAH